MSITQTKRANQARNKGESRSIRTRIKGESMRFKGKSTRFALESKVNQARISLDSHSIQARIHPTNRLIHPAIIRATLFAGFGLERFSAVAFVAVLHTAFDFDSFTHSATALTASRAFHARSILLNALI